MQKYSIQKKDTAKKIIFPYYQQRKLNFENLR